METRGADTTLPESEPVQTPPKERKRSTTRGELPPGPPSITPLQRFQFEHQKARMAYWIAGASLALSLVVVALVVRSVGQEEKVFVLDAAGNSHYGPTVSLSKNQEMLQTISVLATQTAMSRSSVGFDLQEFLKPIFQPIPLRTLHDDLDEQSKDLSTRNIHQIPVIEEVKGPVASGFSKRMEVSGKLVRAGMYSGRPIYEEAPFHLLLSFNKNPNIGDVACYPWVVTAVEITTGQAR